MPAKPLDDSNCLCLSGLAYGECCGRLHRGQADAATAEQLMRARYTAFALLDAQYLLKTWHPDTASSGLELDPGIEWRRLDILSTSRGGPLDSGGTVEFNAHFRHDGERGIQHENSRFVRENRRWYYVEAVLLA